MTTATCPNCQEEIKSIQFWADEINHILPSIALYWYPGDGEFHPSIGVGDSEEDRCCYRRCPISIPKLQEIAKDYVRTLGSLPCNDCGGLIPTPVP